jgi:membrane-bound ClpP family serine protease
MQIAFLIIFSLGLFLAFITFIVGELFDLGGDGGMDSGGPAGEGTPSPLSSRILFVFATAFGGFGFIGTVLEWPTWVSVLAAVVGGLLVAAGTFFLIVLPMAKQQGTTTVRAGDFVNLIGQVTSEIPEGGLGRVTVIAPASQARVGMPARADSGGRIAFGSTVRVLAEGGGVLTVEVATAAAAAESQEPTA